MDKIGIVVNYYRKSPSENRLDNACISYRTGDSDAKAKSIGWNDHFIADGSPKPDRQIESGCLSLGIQYLHSGKELSIPEAYNLGWRSLSEPYIGLMANDILPYDSSTITNLVDFLQRPDTGCVFPYLSEGDWKGQDSRFINAFEKTFEPSFVLLNFICFKRSVLEKIGGVDEGYKGGYYDPILLIKIRQNGYRVVLVGSTKMVHLGKLTKKMSESSIESLQDEKDQAKF